MENALHRFVRLLRLRQVRISIPEALDAMACAREPGMLADKAHLKAALRVALIKDRRDEEVFDEIFDRFFALVKVGPTETGHGHGHGHEDLSDTGALEDFTLEIRPGEVFGLAGPNGAGKSTLISLLLGFLGPSSGAVRIDGHVLNLFKLVSTFDELTRTLSVSLLTNRSVLST